MSLSALDIERRVSGLMLNRMQSTGQLHGLDDQQLAGIGKALKKVAKKVAKVVKKVAPIALGAGALYLGAKVIGGAIKGKPKDATPAAAAAAPVIATVAAPVAAAALQQAVSSGALPQETPAPVMQTASGPSSASQLINTAGQVATALISAQGLPSAAGDPGIQQITREAIAAELPQYLQQQSSYSGGGGGGYVSSAPKAPPGAQYEQMDEVSVTADRIKPYLLPGAIIAGLALLAVMNNNRRA